MEHARNDKGLTREDLAERIRKSERYKYQRASPSFKIECDALIMLFGGRSWLYKGFSLAPIIHYWHPNLVCQSPDLRKFSFFNIAGRLYLPF